ncbi:hypothetical protein [Pedobacter suwonensis]|uniref:hypothetical protein n=1 Tax=Pedobacter suwonensis TaxID=332999 RepID=UPI0011A46543|nr:hypothetical protein [Pedobacter suwonensis]
MKTKNLERVKEFFEKNTETKAVYLTSDGNMFKAEHYASNWAVGLSDKTLTPVTRASILRSETITKALANKAATGLSGDTEVQIQIIPIATKSELSESHEKAELVKRYIELYDKKPNNMLDIPKLK